MKWLVFLCFPVLALSADPSVPPPPTLESNGLNNSAPEVTIRKRDGQEIKEYRINGVLYMIAIKPDNAPVYYLIDTDGDGELETRRRELDPNIMIPSWTLFRW